jgi:hypothetical protein
MKRYAGVAALVMTAFAVSAAPAIAAPNPNPAAPEHAGTACNQRPLPEPEHGTPVGTSPTRAGRSSSQLVKRSATLP